MSMKKARAKFMEYTFSRLRKITSKNHKGVDFIENHLNSLSDNEFHQLMKKAEKGEYVIPFIQPNMDGEEFDFDKLLELAEEIGCEIFHHIEFIDSATGEPYISEVKYPVGIIPVRRPVQHLTKGIGVAEHSSQKDSISGQAAGDSKVSRLSLPEISMLSSRGIKEGLIELLKVKGGDEQAYRAMLSSIEKTGGFSLQPIKEASSRPRSTETVAALLRGRHLKNDVTG